MENTSTDTVIYSLDIDDIQNVANQEIGRGLNAIEIESIVDLIAENIDWYDAIADAIRFKKID